MSLGAAGLAGLAGLVPTTLVILDSESNDNNNELLPLLGVLAAWSGFMYASASALLDDNEVTALQHHGPYSLLKSLDTLPTMLQHTSTLWICYFFRLES
jgi:hypothetical protein